MENRLLIQFNNVITTQWPFKQIEESYKSLTPKELFELAYHCCNSITMRNIFIKLSATMKLYDFLIRLTFFMTY